MEPLALQRIVEYAEGCLRRGDPARVARGITTDSRAVSPGDVFVALAGDKFDGHDFVGQTAAAGAIGAVVRRGLIDANLPSDFGLVEVEDTLLSYQKIAACYRRTMPMRVVGITGSNGKTSTKDYAAAVLGSRFRVLKTEGNFNNHIGVPRMLLRASEKDDVAVLEMGMNHPGEIAPLAAMAAPAVGIITNIGDAHIEYMGTRAAIAQEKGALAEAIGSGGHVVLCADDEYTPSIAARTSATVITVGFERGDVRAESVTYDLSGSRFTIVMGGQSAGAQLPVPGRHMVLNALLAVAAGRVMDVPLAECASGLGNVQLTEGRFESKVVGGLRIFDDSYNANPDSVIAALQTLAQLPAKGRRIAILGRMAELGAASEASHLRVGNAAADHGMDELLGVGPGAELIVEGARKAGLRCAFAVADVQEAARWLHIHAQPDDLILIKGSRSSAMERVLTALSALRGDTVPIPTRP